MSEKADHTIEAKDNEQVERPYSELLVRDSLFPPILHLVPLTDRPFFPGQSMPVFLDENAWLDTVRAVGETDGHEIGLLLLNSDEGGMPGPDDFRKTGCVVRMHDPKALDGQIRFIAEGLARFHVVEWLSDKPPYVVRVEYPKSETGDELKVRAFANAIIATVKELLPLNPLYGGELKIFLNQFSPDNPGPFTDFVANLTSASKDELQVVLETVELLPRMERVLKLVNKELEVARLQTEIRERVDARMSEQQRKFFLKEQLKEIQKELGIAKDDRTAEIDRIKERLENLTLTDQVAKRVDDELQKMSVLEPGSPEFAVTRNYLDWITRLPWGIYSEDAFDLKKARKILDRDHEGLQDVKDRILEFLAVGSFKGNLSGAITLLVGPPGVGKTSIGHSIAEALGRKFYRFSLGGMRDEAEIKGHRRTYIGAMPGKFVQALKEAGTSNPVIMLDEIDKIGTSYQGDPASALLEVLDPEQNVDFVDHYLDVHLDLSKVLFVCTANQLDTIPRPLLDRMEIIHLAGYIASEKFAIAKKHLWRKQLERAGVSDRQIKLSDAALRFLIDGYAREAGVRGLDKQLGRLVRKAVVSLLETNGKQVKITKPRVEEYLGKPIFRDDKPSKGVGVVTGLAWTSMGGSTLDIEATRVHEKNRGLKLTGQLGDVMRESAEIAYSFVTAYIDNGTPQAGYFDNAFIHLHVPEGATPKDGPSAGVTMATALLSLAKGKRVKANIAMTGELT
ncbi:MAG TPA: endopeptidase La, partial [Gammaproteobacteria bacterium]|nr:endopeptidase La [Gammaproteobacteria bacterium]